MYSLEWPRAYGLPQSSAIFKQTPEDFKVNEFFDFEFSGVGEHILLKVEKRGLTTEEVVKALSRLLNKPSKLISYAGLKDRQALTTQWFSIHAPGELINGLESLHGPGWRVLASTRHTKKIRPGYLAGNQFIIHLKDLSNTHDLEQRLEHIKITGVPNYFGEQRFGRAGGNLTGADDLLTKERKIKDRFLKGMYCSAARSWFFNNILAHRVTALNWNKPINGDVMQLCGSNSIFTSDKVDENLLQRVVAKDISPASPLPGKSKNLATRDALAIINAIYSQQLSWINGLDKLGMEESWRANIVHAQDLDYTINNNEAEILFKLPPGSYATTLLRELVIY